MHKTSSLSSRAFFVPSVRSFADTAVASKTPKSSAPQGPPLVKDDMVKVTYVDCRDQRRVLAGRVGKSLVEVCFDHGIYDLLEDFGMGGGAPNQIVHNERWTEDLYGEGVTSNHSQ